MKQLGGMLRYGIPNYRLPREVLDQEINQLLSVGIDVVTEADVGEKPYLLQDIRPQYDAIYIAIGAHTDRKIGMEGEDAEGVMSAVEMLRSIGDGEMPDFKDRDIIVIGGNVAMDVARSAVRLGAKRVRIAYRRRKVDMTALPEEVEGAVAEGCEVLDLHAPLSIEKDEQGKVSALWVQPQLIGKIKNGRPSPGDADVPKLRLPCYRTRH